MKSYLLLIVLLVTINCSIQLFAQNITNYTFSASSGVFTPLSGSTTMYMSGGNQDDGYYNNIPIGFSFCYMGIPYSTISASTNGWIAFDQLLSSSPYVNNLTSGTPRPLIAPLWDDLRIQADTNFRYQTNGTNPNRIFTAEWLNMKWNLSATGNTISFQVNLYETSGIVEFIYRDEGGTVNNGSASIGINTIGTGTGNFLSLNGTGTNPSVSSTTETGTLNIKPASGQKYIFTPPVSGEVADPINLSFTSVTSYGMTMNWTDNSTNETFFVIIRALDSDFSQGVAISYLGSTTSGGTGTAYNIQVNGLSPLTTYYFKITAARENASSTGIIGNQSTSALIPMNGNYNVGVGQDFEALTTAVATLNSNGVDGPVTLFLTDEIYSSAETFPLVINAIQGSSEINIVTVQPAAGVSPIISGNSSTAIIKLNGTHHFILDGSNNGGTSRDLLIKNTANTGTTAVVWIGSPGAGLGAVNGTIKNCNILNGYNTSNSYGIYLGASSSIGTSGLDNNMISILNNSISKAYYGIFSFGANTGLFNNLEISDNEIGSSIVSDYIGYYGIFISGANSPIINGNEVFNMITSTSTNITGICLNSYVTNPEIYCNVIHDLKNNNAGGWPAWGINIVASTVTGAQIINNVIYNINTINYSATSTTYNPFGIRITAGQGHKIYHNTVHLTGTQFNIGTAGSLSACLIITSNIVTGLDIRDNIFTNNLEGMAGTKSYAIYAVSGTTFSNIDYNDYYAYGPYGLLGFLGSDKSNLAEWQAATSQDVNSVVTDPEYFSSDQLIPTNGELNNLGVNLAEVPEDITGTARATPPDIGAYEFGAEIDLIINTLGSSANTFTCGYDNGNSTQLWYNKDINTIANIHRMGGSVGPEGQYSGDLAYDISFDGGETWTSQINIYTSNIPGGSYNLDAARYPQAAIYNPGGNTDPDNAYIAYFAPALDGSNGGSWGGYAYGTGLMGDILDTTKHLLTSNPTNEVYQNIPKAFCIAGDGKAWMAESSMLNATAYDGNIIIMKGVFNNETGDFQYEQFLVPVSAENVRSLKIAFDPTGQIGYIYWNDNNGSIPEMEGWSYPLFIKTSDFGVSWSSVQSVNLGGTNGISGIKNWLTDEQIAEIWDSPLPSRDEIIYTTPYFNTDVAADAWGNPHFITTVFVCGPGYGYGQFLTDQETFGVFDIYSTDQGGSEWHAVHLGTLKTTSHNYGGNTEYNRTSVSSTADGKCLFYTWLDTRAAGETTNSSPDIYARGFDHSRNLLTNDLTTMSVAGATNVTAFSEAQSQAYFQSLSTYCIDEGTLGDRTYTLPITYADMDPLDANQPVLFKYIKNFSFHDSDFVLQASNDPIIDDFTWTGTGSQAWNNTINWDLFSMPNTTSSVYIPGEPLNQPILNIDATIARLTLQQGSEIIIDTGSVLTVTDSLFIDQQDPQDSTKLIIKGELHLTNGFPPSQPTNPNPPDSSAYQDVLITLSWTCSDPKGLSLVYDVYFGTNPNPEILIANDISDNFLSVGDSLTLLTSYFWKIVAKNSKGNIATGEIWQFSTTGWQNCGDSIYYEGKSYASVEIGSQCWMKQNLNVGVDLGEEEWPSDNSIIEKWSSEYGGYYDWNEMMKYGIAPGNQGICPPGWHVPTDGEWKVLEGATDSQYGMGDPIWDSISYRGYDAGLNLKANDTWMTPGNGTDLYGFTAFAAGYHSDYLTGTNSDAVFWSSTERNEATSFTRHLVYYLDQIGRGGSLKWFGNAVRCLKNSGGISFFPVDPYPLDNSSNQNRKIILQWSCINPEEIELKYDIYFDTLPDPEMIIASNVDSSSFIIADSLSSLTTYYWKIIAKDLNGSSNSGDIWQFTTGTGDWSCGDSINYQSETYPTIQIGTQCWLGQNLNAGIRINGAENQMNNNSIEKYCYEDNETNCSIYGGLYQWDEMMQYMTSAGSPGICPPGWHIPTTFEWCTLTTYLDSTVICDVNDVTGTNVGGKLKESGTIHWNMPNEGATNESGFTGLPGGYRFSDQLYHYLGNTGIFWTSSQYSETKSKGRYLRYNYADIGQSNGYYKTDGLSVRCLSDIGLNAPPYAPANPNPPDSSTIQSTSIVLSWICSDLESDPLTFDIYLDSIPDPVIIIASDISSNSFAVADSLSINQTYYWKIIAKDNKGNNTPGRIWQFTTREWRCGDSISYMGHGYSSIQIGYQCWLMENLNVGERIDGSQNQANNTIIEKYCYNDLESNCDIYGGLYQWDEMMQYSMQEGIQGICPVGWHIPTDVEWCLLSTHIDPTVDCNVNLGYSGTDAGIKMKSTSGWYEGGNGTNVSGFNAIPGGRRHNNQAFYSIETGALFWSSTQYETINARQRTLAYDHNTIHRGYYTQTDGVSVRCMKDINLPPLVPLNPSPADNATNVDLMVTLSWSCSDPENDSIFYDVYFDSIPVPDSIVGVNIVTNTFTIEGPLTPLTTYYWKIVANDDQDSISEGDIWQFTTRNFLCGDSMDYEGQIYHSIQIGSQCWMKENLNVGVHVSSGGNQQNNAIIEKYCWVGVESYCDVYGGLYQWNEMMQYSTIEGTQGICPTGWHIPSDGEWCTLSTYLDPTVNCGTSGSTGATAAGKLKESGLIHWSSPNSGATNESGFTALPAGERTNPNTFGMININAFLWSSSNNNSTTAWDWRCSYNSASVIRNIDYKTYGKSVRCVCDEDMTDTTSLSQYMIGYWRIDELNGNVAHDACGNNDCTVQNGVTLNQSGIIGKASSFVDTSGGLTTGKTASQLGIGGGTSKSISLWIKPNVAVSGPNSNGIINLGTMSNQQQFGIKLYGGIGSEYWMFDSWYGAVQIGPIGNELSDGSWHHIVVSYSSNGHKLRTYLDGNFVTEDASKTLNTGDNMPFSIGIGSQGKFIGAIDEVGLWQRPLTDEEVEILYNSGNGKSYPFKLGVPNHPYPPDNSTSVGLDVTLNWSCLEPYGNPLTFDIYCDTISNPQVIIANDTSAFSFHIPDSLEPYKTYYWKIIAHDLIGDSTVSDIWSFTTGSGDWQCGDSISVEHIAGAVAPVSKTVIYGTVNNIPGENAKCWITSNLGADHQATAVNDATEASAGWYWQFNLMQGYKYDGGRTPNTTWITSISGYTNWLLGNDPCTIEIGNGWRLPTSTEWTNVDATGGWVNWNGPWNSALKLHTAGYLWYGDGSLQYRGEYGYYWSSNYSGNTLSKSLLFSSGVSWIGELPKSNGNTVRCLRE